MKRSMSTKTKVNTRTIVAMTAGGLVVAAGIVSLVALRNGSVLNRPNRDISNQSQCAPGYVPGYLPRTPGYTIARYGCIPQVPQSGRVVVPRPPASPTGKTPLLDKIFKKN